MSIPSFTQPTLNDRLLVAGLGDAFQALVHHLLEPQFPGLHRFPGAGKDGCIDLIAPTVNGRVVIECKQIAMDGLEHAQRQWREVADKLARNLADPSGPPRGQAQYDPWYRTDVPINRYLFVVSSLVKNARGIDDIRDEITGFFAKLANAHSHLSHLSRIGVEVLDWSDLTVLLEKNAYLVFRWFPRTRPNGLVPIDDTPTEAGFRSYLEAAKLPYYSHAAHAARNPPPSGVDALGESTIIDWLSDDTLTGVVITGAGGVGKTRMDLEIGRIAQARGWVVLRVVGKLRDDALERLVERLTPGQRVLLALDYIETQRDFAEVVDRIIALNATYSLHIRYVANCRTTYYHAAVGPTPQHRQVDLSPPVLGESAKWLAAYRAATIDHILTHGGLPADNAHRVLCRGVPVLAVFLAYLRDLGKDDDLRELLQVGEFGQWVARRVQMSFGQANISRDLAVLAAMFPMRPEVVERLDDSVTRRLFDLLAADRWIERIPSEPSGGRDQWVSIHDVLTDRLVLSYCKSIPGTRPEFVRELLGRAIVAQTLRSVLLTLQRVADQSELDEIDWMDLLLDMTGRAPEQWRSVRDLLIGTSLLSPREIVALLERRADLWEGAEADPALQSRLGWLARRLTDEATQTIPDPARTVLIHWICKVAPYAESNNYVLTWGLRLRPHDVRDAALAWLSRHANWFDAHYLLVAWLEQGLGPETVVDFVRSWATQFQNHVNLSFLVRAWLDAGGGVDAVRERVLAWLAKQGQEEAAQFVYTAWLNAGGGVGAVRERVLAWLAKHGQEEAAQFVYTAWLDGSGGVDAVRDRVLAWLAEHYQKETVDFVYTAWLNAGGGAVAVRERVLAWLAEHGQEEAAQFPYAAWLNAGGGVVAVRERVLSWLHKHGQIETAQFVYAAWLNAGGGLDPVRERLLAWVAEYGQKEVARFVYVGWLNSGEGTDVVQERMLQWLKVHQELPDADFMFRAWLEAGCEPLAVRDLATAWLHKHFREQRAVYITKWLARDYEISAEVAADILVWCRTFPDDPDALWRLSTLFRRHAHKLPPQEVWDAAELVILHTLSDRPVLDEIARFQITGMLFVLITSPKLLREPIRGRVNVLLIQWLRFSPSFGPDLPSDEAIQDAHYLFRVVKLVELGQLDAVNDRAALDRFVQWINTWTTERRAALGGWVVLLKRKFGADSPWAGIQVQ